MKNKVHDFHNEKLQFVLYFRGNELSECDHSWADGLAVLVGPPRKVGVLQQPVAVEEVDQAQLSHEALALLHAAQDPHTSGRARPRQRGSCSGSCDQRQR